MQASRYTPEQPTLERFNLCIENSCGHSYHSLLLCFEFRMSSLFLNSRMSTFFNNYYMTTSTRDEVVLFTF